MEKNTVVLKYDVCESSRRGTMKPRRREQSARDSKISATAVTQQARRFHNFHDNAGQQDMLRFEKTLEIEDGFETSFMVESIGLFCLVETCFPISDFSATYEGGEINRRPVSLSNP